MSDLGSFSIRAFVVSYWRNRAKGLSRRLSKHIAWHNPVRYLYPGEWR